MSMRKLSALTAVTSAALTLAACGDTDDSATGTTSPVSAAESSVAEEVATESVSRAPADDDDDQPQPATGQNNLPAEVTGYTGEAKSDMAEEGVTTQDVERVLAAANGGEAGVEMEWEDDGYWEIEFDHIDSDIDPNGLVLDVDRDD